MGKHKFQWAGLDTAANIFPCTSTKRDTMVFRFTCELTEEVQPQLLQQAIDEAIEAFPNYRAVLKRGLFWYYLESSDLRPIVRAEYKDPCAPLYDEDVHTLLFEVTYYGKRINLEIYHVLTDGSGAIEFLRLLVYDYLLLAHPKELAGVEALDYDASETQRMDDSFERYATRQKGPKAPPKLPAYRLRGPMTADNRLSVIVGTVPLSAMLELSHRYHCSLTVLLCALLTSAIAEEMTVEQRAKQGVVLAVPIDLRKHFRSASARNFFGVMDVSYLPAKGDGSLEDMVHSFKEQFQHGLTPELLQFRVNQYMGLIRLPITRITPLAVKNMVMRLGYHATDRAETAAVSNVGVIRMPAALSPYIRKFDVFVSTAKLQLCITSYHDLMTLGFSSGFVSTDIQCRFFRALAAHGVPVEVDADLLEE